MRKIMLLGMGRSGTHAIIQWIANGMNGVVRQENNCFNGWEKKKFIHNSLKVTGKGEPVGVIKSIDDFYLPLWDKFGMTEWEKFDNIIYVVRSPRNWLASSIAAGGWANRYLNEPPKDEIELPVSRICACIEYLKEYEFKFRTEKEIIINYDRWHNKDVYRANLANKIGLLFYGIVPKHCKFSSFGKNHDYTGDRYELLDDKQKKRFDKLYNSSKLRYYQEKYWE